MITKLPPQSLRALLSQVIDYAGMYPPANLPLDKAIENFVKYQTAKEVWMLSRFVVPAKRLAELSRLAERVFPREHLLSFSALGRSGNGETEFLDNLHSDIEDVRVFRQLHGEAVVVDLFETALPASALKDPARNLELVNKITDLLNKNGLTVFLEMPFDEAWQSAAGQLIRCLRKIKDKHVGFKLRTGGVVPEAFPTPRQVAWAIATLRDAGLPMKATAGLHHAIRHYDASVSAKMHGFLNVFVGGVLAWTHNLPVETIEEIINDEDPSNFVFDSTGFSWGKLRASLEQIAHARREVLSFGSCSFDEPREDLHKIGLMEAAEA